MVMRIQFAIVLVMSSALSAATPVASADRSTRSRNARVYGYQGSGRAENSPYDRLRDARPEGNYPGLPDWAQRAFASKGH
jgi:hypothetical protein